MAEDTLVSILNALQSIRVDINVLADNQKYLLRRIELLDVELPMDAEQVHRLLMDVADIERRTRSLELAHHG